MKQFELFLILTNSLMNTVNLLKITLIFLNDIFKILLFGGGSVGGGSGATFELFQDFFLVYSVV